MRLHDAAYALLVMLMACSGDMDDAGRLEPVSRTESGRVDDNETSSEVETNQGARARGASDESPREKEERTRMVREQIAARGVDDARVLSAMERVPRQEFVPMHARGLAYEDGPLAIGYDQTISQPYVVALMTELLRLPPNARVLEIGTGSGYQAAVLAEIARDVYSIEIVEPLAERAQRDLSRLGYDNVHVRAGDGYRGWPEKAPFDGIIVTAAAPSIPKPLLEQLAHGARLVIPVGDWDQELRVITRTERGFEEKREIPVRFVPMTGQARKR